MTGQNLVEKWSACGPYLQSVLRVAAAVMFILAGTIGLFQFPEAAPDGRGPSPLFSQMWIGNVLQVVGGALMLIGLFTRPTAFILSGEMAVAYFQFHASSGFWPNLNGGLAAVLYCFIWLYFSAAGAGPWSLDAMRRK
jgi:putative oxidoreductase